jgi:hypothetical protein
VHLYNKVSKESTVVYLIAQVVAITLSKKNKLDYIPYKNNAYFIAYQCGTMVFVLRNFHQN